MGGAVIVGWTVLFLSDMCSLYKMFCMYVHMSFVHVPTGLSCHIGLLWCHPPVVSTSTLMVILSGASWKILTGMPMLTNIYDGVDNSLVL